MESIPCLITQTVDVLTTQSWLEKPASRVATDAYNVVLISRIPKLGYAYLPSPWKARSMGRRSHWSEYGRRDLLNCRRNYPAQHGKRTFSEGRHHEAEGQITRHRQSKRKVRTRRISSFESDEIVGVHNDRHPAVTTFSISNPATE